MRSRLYECSVMHHRFTPKVHRFTYRIFLFAIDLDELPQLHRQLRLFSHHRRNIFSFRDADFFPTDSTLHNPTSSFAPRASRLTPSDLKTRVLAHLNAHGIEAASDTRVLLLTLPRVFGYLFNPVSFYFCTTADGRPLASIAEVTNTFRETKPYLLGPSALQPDTATPTFHLRTPKHFYVSPFSDVTLAFDFKLRLPTPEKLSIQIDDYDGPTRTLTSTLHGPARPLNDRTLAWFTLKYPLITLAIIARIHWHALRLYWKKLPWYAKAARPKDQRDLYRPHTSISPIT